MRTAVLFALLFATWRCWGNAYTSAFTRDVCVFARLDARPEREAQTCFVTVGDDDLKKYPARDPLYLDRRYYARAIDRLSDLGASAIVVDVLFDRPTPEGPAADAALGAAIRRSGRVILAHLLSKDDGTGKVVLVNPIPQLAAGAAGLGLVNVVTDKDDVMRHVQLIGRAPDGSFVRYSAMQAAVFLSRREPELADEGPIVYLPDGPRLIPTDSNDAALPDLTAVPKIPRIPLAELLEPGPLLAVHRSLVAGKVVVIGSTSALLKDRHPFVRNWFSGNRTLMDGAWFIAAITENIFAGTFVDGLDGSLGWPLGLALVLFATLVSVQTWRRGLVSTACGVLVAWLLALHAYTRHLLVDASLVSLAAVSLYGVSSAVGQLLEKRRVHHLNRELSMEVQKVRGELEEASRIGRSQAEGGAVPGYLDKTFVARYLPERYTELKHLGAGGMGVVFKGHDKETGQAVALKVLSPLVQDNPNAVKRFLIEGRTLQELDHPGLVKVIDIQKEPLSYFAMELVVGTPLDELVSEGKSLAVKKAVDIVIRVGEVLGYVHSRSLVHRDIKPSNIMVLPDGSVKLLDFGLVHDEGLTAITKTGDVLGTLKYMAPEQFAGGKCSPATDVYSLTVVLCQLLTGNVPPRLGHFHQPPSEYLSNQPLPRPFVDLLTRSMEVDSTKRPVDGAELARKLREVRAFLDKTVGY